MSGNHGQNCSLIAHPDDWASVNDALSALAVPTVVLTSNGPIFEFSCELALPALERLRVLLASVYSWSQLITIVGDQNLELICSVGASTLMVGSSRRTVLDGAVEGLSQLKSGIIVFDVPTGLPKAKKRLARWVDRCLLPSCAVVCRFV